MIREKEHRDPRPGEIPLQVPTQKDPDPIRHEPRRDFFFSEPHANIDGSRSEHHITALVGHRTISEDHTAAAICNFFRGNSDAGSTTFVLDSDQLQQVMPITAVCQGASSNGHEVNSWGVHTEFCATMSYTKVIFLRKHREMFRRGVVHFARLCKKYDIQPRWLSASRLRAGGRNGITDHNEVSKAWVPGGHYDNLPARRLFISSVKRELRRMNGNRKEKRDGKK